MPKHKLIDTSDELLLQRWGGGFMLVRPDKKTYDSSSFIQPSIPLAEVLKKTFDVYLYDLEHYFQMVNEEFVKTGEIDSVKSILGKNVINVFPKESYALIQNNIAVLSTARTQISEEELSPIKDTYQQYLSIKAPLYSESSELIGIFGCSILLGTSRVAESLQEIANLGILNRPMVTNANLITGASKFAQLPFSKRERDCLYLLVRGNTAKDIAKILNISPRTVEVYLDNIKFKTGLTSRSELIENLIDLFS